MKDEKDLSPELIDQVTNDQKNRLAIRIEKHARLLDILSEKQLKQELAYIDEW